MSKYEKYKPVSDALSFKRMFFWYLIPGIKIKLSFHNDPIEMVDWMEQQVGECGNDWDWDWYLDFPENDMKLYYIVKLRKKKSHYKSIILLRFS